MPCEDGQHETYKPDDSPSGEKKWADFVLWKNSDKTRLIRIQLCKNCKLLYWDDIVEKRVPKYIEIDKNDPSKGWQFGKPDRPEIKNKTFANVKQYTKKSRMRPVLG